MSIYKDVPLSECPAIQKAVKKLEEMESPPPECLLGTPAKEFEINCYLDETYSFTSYDFKGASCMAAILTALLKKDRKVIPICVWTLGSHEVRFSGDGVYRKKPTSFVEILQKKEVTKAASFETDPAMKEWVKTISTAPGFEIFTLALAMFILGFPRRKITSQRNQLDGGKWENILKDMSSFAPSLPERIEIKFLEEVSLSNFKMKSACGACLFLQGSHLAKRLRRPISYGLVRPVCEREYMTFVKYQEFKQLYPEAFRRNSRFSSLPHASKGLESVKEFEEAIVAAKKAKAELQPLMIRTIYRGYFRSMDVSLTKYFQTYLIYCICHRKGRCGRESWQAYAESEAGKKKCNNVELGQYQKWISSLRV